MTRSRVLFPVAIALLVVGAMCGSPSEAKATFQVRISTDGGSTFGTTITDGFGGGGAGTITDYQFNTGSGTLIINASEYTDSTLTVLDLNVATKAGDGLSGAHDIVVQATLTDITTGPALELLSTTFSASSLDSNAAATAQTWVDNSNALYGTSGTTTGSLSPGSAVNPGFVGSINGIPSYSMTTQYHLTSTTKIANGSIAADDLNQITPAPAPGGLALVLGALPFGVRAWRRR